jgi:hypothetical protein
MSAALSCAVLLHVFSLHFASGLNGDNPGVGLTCDYGRATFAVGGFKNSEGGQSRYAVGGLYAGAWGPLKAGAVVGVIDGYQGNEGAAQPVAAAVASAQLTERVGLRVLVVPHVRGVSSSATHVALSVGF